LPPLSTLLLKASPLPPEVAAEAAAVEAVIETPAELDALNAGDAGLETVSTTVIEDSAARPPTKRTRQKVAPPAEAVTKPVVPVEPPVTLATPANPAPATETEPAPDPETAATPRKRTRKAGDSAQ